MQIGSLLNTLMSLPGVGASAGALPGQADPIVQAGADPLMAAVAQTQASGQFASLVSPTNPGVTLNPAQLNALTPGSPVQQTPLNSKAFDPNLLGLMKKSAKAENTDTPPGDAANNPQTSGIAIPPIPVYIDQAVDNKLFLDKSTNIVDDSSKQRIFENEMKEYAALQTASGKVKAAASEVANDQRIINPNIRAPRDINTAKEVSTFEVAQLELKPEVAITANAAKFQTPVVDTDPSVSKVQTPVTDVQAQEVASADIQNEKGIAIPKELQAKAEVSDDDFQKAVADIVSQAKTKNADGTVKPKITEVIDTAQNAKVDADTKLTAKLGAETQTATAQPQQVAAKISAKILNVKTDKIKLDTDVAADELSTKLQDFDSMLRGKNFTSIKAAHEAVVSTPADQVQVKVSQAIERGLDKISINLHPAELGAVDVDLEYDEEGKTKIRISADKAETLDLLRRDSHSLTKSLADAGIKSDAGSMQFSLRNGGDQNRNFSNDNNQNNNNNQNQKTAAVTDNYTRYSRINEQELRLSVANKNLNILV